MLAFLGGSQLWQLRRVAAKLRKAIDKSAADLEKLMEEEVQLDHDGSSAE
jgi:hypothetical protein